MAWSEQPSAIPSAKEGVVWGMHGLKIALLDSDTLYDSDKIFNPSEILIPQL